MGLFRNPEVKKTAIIYGITSVILSAAACYRSLSHGLCVLLAACVFCALAYILTRRRYKKLSGLCSEIDEILHSGKGLILENEQEGEFGILRSEISKMTVRLREQADRLEREGRYLADSMADISHQLRTPLTSLNLIMSMLSEPDISDDRRLKLSREARSLLMRLDWLVSSLLMISKLDAGTAVFKSQEISVRELLKRALEPLVIPMEIKEQKLILTVGEERFTGDFSWSAEAVGNILKNAIEHVQPGGEIRVTSLENAVFTEIIIADNGPGIDPEDLPHLFQRFYKGKGSAEGSIGIGLALAHMIVRRQNGSLAVYNSPYGGAKFVIRIYKSVV